MFMLLTLILNIKTEMHTWINNEKQEGKNWSAIFVAWKLGLFGWFWDFWDSWITNQTESQQIAFDINKFSI